MREQSHHIELNAEKLSSVYRVEGFQSSHQEIKDVYNQGKYLRWTFYIDGFDIKLWPADKFEHEDVDPHQTFHIGTTGSMSKKHGIHFSDERLFTVEEKKAIRAAILEYLK